MINVYKKTILLLIIWVGFYLISPGQNQVLDSLLKLEKNYSDKDSFKVELLTKIANQYYTIDLEKLRDYSEKAKLLSDEIGYSKGKVDGLQKIALYYRINGKLDSAMIYTQEALELSIRMEYYLGVAKCNLTLGNICRQNNEFQNSNKYYKESEIYFKKINHIGGLAAVKCNLAINFKRVYNYAEALNYYQSALELYKQIEDVRNQALVYSNLAVMYRHLGDDQKAIDHYLLTIELSHNVGDKFKEARSLNGIALILIKMEDYKEAESYIQKAFKVAEESNFMKSIATANKNMALIYSKQNQLQKAIESLNKTIEICQEINYKYVLHEAFNDLADLYIRLGKDSQALSNYQKALEIQKQELFTGALSNTYNRMGDFYLRLDNHKQAEVYFNKGLEIANEDKNLTNIRDAAKGLSGVYEAKGEFEASLVYFKLYKEMSDSVLNLEESKKITRQLLSFEHEKELNRIALEQNENNRIQEMEKHKIQSAKNYFLIAFLFSVLLAIAIFISLSRKRKANILLTELLDFKQLMTRTIVHDLKNPLNSIINLAKNPSVKESGKQMLNMVMNILDVYKYEESRIVLDKSEFSLFELTQSAINKVSLLAKNKNIKLKNEIEQHISVNADIEIIERVFVNLMTNAIKHTPVNGKITINCTVSILNSNKELIIQVTDTGVGIPADKINGVFNKFAQIEDLKSGGLGSTGIGLTFCKMAVEAHEGKIGVDSKEGMGSTFWFTLPNVKITEMKKEISKDTHEHIVDDSINLSAEHKEIIKIILNEMDTLDIYFVTKIKEQLTRIRNLEIAQLEPWLHEIDISLEQCNNEKYRKLLDELRLAL